MNPLGTPLTRAIAVTLIQLLLVCSLGAKLLYDRRTRPQVWFKTARYDPNLPIRGRYLALQIEVNDPRTPEEIEQKFGPVPQFAWGYARECGSIVSQNGVPAVEFDKSAAWDCDNLTFERWRANNGSLHLRINDPVLFFIPDTAKDPSGVARGDELLVLATIPRKGPPRPIALGIKRAGMQDIQRLDLD